MEEKIENQEMGSRGRVSPFSHPFFTSLLPGYAGLAAGLIFAVCASVAGFRFTNLFVPIEHPDIGESQLTLLRIVNVLVPWALFLAGVVIGVLLMLLQRRLLRKHMSFLVESMLRPKTELSWRRLRIEWPVCLLVFLIMPAMAFPRESFQSALVTLAGWGGLPVGFLVTRRERTEAFRQAMSIAYGDKGPDPQFMRKVRRISIGALSILVVCLAYVIYSTARIAHLSRQLENTLRPAVATKQQADP